MINVNKSTNNCTLYNYIPYIHKQENKDMRCIYHRGEDRGQMAVNLGYNYLIIIEEKSR